MSASVSAKKRRRQEEETKKAKVATKTGPRRLPEQKSHTPSNQIKSNHSALYWRISVQRDIHSKFPKPHNHHTRRRQTILSRTTSCPLLLLTCLFKPHKGGVVVDRHCPMAVQVKHAAVVHALRVASGSAVLKKGICFPQVLGAAPPVG